MKNLKVIFLKSEFKSYAWNDGLFAVYLEENGVLHLWKIKEGRLDRYDDDTPNIVCTSVNNKGVRPTDLTISVSESF